MSHNFEIAHEVLKVQLNENVKILQIIHFTSSFMGHFASTDVESVSSIFFPSFIKHSPISMESFCSLVFFVVLSVNGCAQKFIEHIFNTITMMD